jgi:hypothetical protein
MVADREEGAAGAMTGGEVETAGLYSTDDAMHEPDTFLARNI